MSAGPNRLTEAYKARKRIRDARYRQENRAPCVLRSKHGRALGQQKQERA